MRRLLFFIIMFVFCVNILAQSNGGIRLQAGKLLKEYHSSFCMKDWNRAKESLRKLKRLRYYKDSVSLYSKQLDYYLTIDTIVLQMRAKNQNLACATFANLNKKYVTKPIGIEQEGSWASFYNLIPMVMENSLYITPEFSDSIYKNHEIVIDISNSDFTIGGRKIKMPKTLKPALIIDSLFYVKNGIGGLHGICRMDSLQGLTGYEMIDKILKAVGNATKIDIFYNLAGRRVHNSEVEEKRAVEDSHVTKELDSFLFPYQNAHNRWGYADAMGNEVIPAIYESATPFSSGIGIVKTDNQWGYVDIFGNSTMSMCTSTPSL